MVRVEGHEKTYSSRRGRGNVGIPKGFPQSVERVGSRLHGFPPFPYSVISMACFSRGKCWINRYAATQCNMPHSPRDAHLVPQASPLQSPSKGRQPHCEARLWHAKVCDKTPLNFPLQARYLLAITLRSSARFSL